MTTAAPTISARIHSQNRPNIVSIGTIVWLSSELMFFAGLFGVYFTVRAHNVGEWPPPPTELDVPYALIVTIVLVASSFTCQLGVFAAERGDVFGLRRWYLVTLAMGTFFVLGQANEYRHLVEAGTTILVLSSVTCQIGVFAAERGDVYKMRIWYVITLVMGLIFVLGQANEYRVQYGEGMKLSTDGYGSVFYMTTGFHGLHVIGGLFAFLIVLGRSMVGRYSPEKATTAIVVSYYWHFVDVVWIGLYATIYIIQ